MAGPGDQLAGIMAEARAAVGGELVDRARNLFGELRPETRARLMAVITDPGPDTWDAAQSIILNPDLGMGRTLWQAMILVDPTCPKQGRPEGLGDRTTPTQRWAGYIPDPMLVLAAISNAVNEQPRKGTDRP